MKIETKQEKKNIVRISHQLRAATLLSEFAKMGFRTFQGVRSTLIYHDNTITFDEAKQFWQISYLCNTELCDKIEVIIDKLKNS